MEEIQVKRDERIQHRIPPALRPLSDGGRRLIASQNEVVKKIALRVVRAVDKPPSPHRDQHSENEDAGPEDNSPSIRCTQPLPSSADPEKNQAWRAQQRERMRQVGHAGQQAGPAWTASKDELRRSHN